MTARIKTAGTVRRCLLAAIMAGAVLYGQASAAAITLEGRGGWFRPSSGDFRGAYTGGFTAGGGLTVRAAKNLDIWLGADYFSKNGELTYTEEPVSIRMTTALAGLKYFLGRAAVRPYLGAALGWWFYKESGAIGSVSGNDMGFIGQGGADVRLSGSLSLDLFGRYGFCKAKPDDDEAAASQIGGLTFGAGLRLRI